MNSISGGGDIVTSITAIAPLTANGVSGTPESGTVTLATVNSAPPASSVVTAAFGGLSDGTAVQNTLGYDVILNIAPTGTIAAAATFVLGVGPTNPPVTNPVTPSFSNITSDTFTFAAYVPNGYWVLVTHTGLIGTVNLVVQAMGV